MTDDVTTIRVGSFGEIPASEMLRFLQTFKAAHDGLLILGEMLEAASDTLTGKRRDIFVGGLPLWEYTGVWTVDSVELQRYIPPQNELIVRSVSVSSPGIWEFVGAWNPLTFILDLVKHMDGRRKDKKYREAAEMRSLELDNLIKENEFISGRLALAEQAGLTTQQRTALFNRLAIQPLQQLSAVHAVGLIVHPDTLELGSERDTSASDQGGENPWDGPTLR